MMNFSWNKSENCLDFSIFHNFAGFETFLLLCRNRDGEEKVVYRNLFSIFTKHIA